MALGTEAPAHPVRTRDATRTRRLLLAAARRRFADDGYASTTVRQVAEDAGVNLALIKRYFGSKEGLFEACLQTAVDELREESEPSSRLSDVAAAMSHQVVGSRGRGAADGSSDPPGGGPTPSDTLLLLLRSSGDEAADALRRAVLVRRSHQLVDALRSVDGAGTATQPTDGELLRAQVALATTVGIAVLRSSPGLEPLRSATPEQLAVVLEDVLRAVAGGGDREDRPA